MGLFHIDSSYCFDINIMSRKARVLVLVFNKYLGYMNLIQCLNISPEISLVRFFLKYPNLIS